MAHAGLVLEALLGKAHAEYQPRLHRWAERLLHDEVAAPSAEARRECAGRSCAPAVEEARHYFASNAAGCSMARSGRRDPASAPASWKRAAKQ